MFSPNLHFLRASVRDLGQNGSDGQTDGQHRCLMRYPIRRSYNNINKLANGTGCQTHDVYDKAVVTTTIRRGFEFDCLSKVIKFIVTSPASLFPCCSHAELFHRQCMPTCKVNRKGRTLTHNDIKIPENFQIWTWQPWLRLRDIRPRKFSFQSVQRGLLPR